MKVMRKTINVLKRAAKWYFNHSCYSDAFCPSGMIPYGYEK